MNLENHLNDIAASIQNGDYNTSEMKLKLDKAILEVKGTTFTYEAQTVFPELIEHLKTFKSYGKQSKAKAIATLQDIQRELVSKKPNDKVMLSKFQLITDTNFFTDKLQKKMMIDVLISRKTTFQTEYVEVI